MLAFDILGDQAPQAPPIFASNVCCFVGSKLTFMSEMYCKYIYDFQGAIVEVDV